MKIDINIDIQSKADHPRRAYTGTIFAPVILTLM